MVAQIHRTEADAGGPPGEVRPERPQPGGGRLLLLDAWLHVVSAGSPEAPHGRAPEQDAPRRRIPPSHVRQAPHVSPTRVLFVVLRVALFFYTTPVFCPASSEYMEPFERRDLRAFSAEPLLVYPTHYTGEAGYVSDTETSVVWDNETVKTDWDRAKSRKTQEQGELSFKAQNSDVLQSELENVSARDEL